MRRWGEQAGWPPGASAVYTSCVGLWLRYMVHLVLACLWVLGCCCRFYAAALLALGPFSLGAQPLPRTCYPNSSIRLSILVRAALSKR